MGGADSRLREAAQALQVDNLETAEIILRGRLREQPDDARAICLFADLAARLSYHQEAEELLRLAIEVAPGSDLGEVPLARLLYQQNRPEEALDVLASRRDEARPRLDALNLKAAALVRAGRTVEAEQAYINSLRRGPEQAAIWSSYGQLLRTLGRIEEGIAASRRAINLAPSSGHLWWSLSDFKTFKFGPADIAKIEAAFQDVHRHEAEEALLHFALGKALEDVGRTAESFRHYVQGNQLIKASTAYDPNLITGYVDAAEKTFSKLFASTSIGTGCAATDPIFLVGMPRSGSTLLEQMLGGHSQIEATMELPELLDIGEALVSDLCELPATLARLQAVDLERLGRAYIDGTRRYRRTDKPLFVDKMPNNWMYIPLIHLILPNARIVDIRRHPLDCSVSNFKQMFLNGQRFSNDLEWMGRYYADYVAFMRSIDQLLPGRVHRVMYEELVDSPEAEIRRLLGYVGVDFETECLRFHEGERVVRTTSADQVRQPINRQGIGSWHAYDPWLGPLKAALGEALNCYPQVPPA
jgi:Tfp pilus assembly protein PilF